jgi:heat shock protein 1/8
LLSLALQLVDYHVLTTTSTSTFTTVSDQQVQVQFPVFQGERVNCEDNTSLGEFTLAPIPPMKAGEAVLEVVFEVDVNGILKVTATEKTSGRSANITISNSVGKLNSAEIENMINGKSNSSVRLDLALT